jgi:amidase
MKIVTRIRDRRIRSVARMGAAALLTLLASGFASGQSKGFQIEEMTIKGLHRAIQDGETTCRQVVQAYLDRAKAYNGMCTALVTKDGAPVPPVTGVVRAGSPIKFPTETVAVSKVLPDFDQYKGLPIDFGRMEPTLSDPGVQHNLA